MKEVLFRWVALGFLLLNSCSPLDASSDNSHVVEDAVVTTEVESDGLPIPDLPSDTTLSPTVQKNVEITTTPVIYPSGTDWQILPGHFVLSRPIADENNDAIERSYAFGSTLNGERDVHHGVEFTNTIGTPVLAAADGIVIAAGSDHENIYGNGPDFYGNLVVIQHNLNNVESPLYTLYGHLSAIQVQIGDQVKVGDAIGQVGKSGRAMGMHLHFEVRGGNGSYSEVMNPELWLEPHPGNGVLVGKIINPEGEIRFLSGIKVELITTAKKPPTYRPEPYGDPNLVRDQDFDEVFLVGDLPAGKYRVSFTPSSLVQVVEVEILPGLVTDVTLHSKR